MTCASRTNHHILRQMSLLSYRSIAWFVFRSWFRELHRQPRAAVTYEQYITFNKTQLNSDVQTRTIVCRGSYL